MRTPVLLFALACMPVHAVEVRCVDTPSEINAALALSEDEAVEMRVVAGTYDLTGTGFAFGTVFLDIQEGLFVRGGYAPGCGSRTLDGTATVFTIPAGGFSAYGNGVDLTFESLTFRNMPEGVRLSNEGLTTNDYTLRLRRVWFDNTGRIEAERSSRVNLSQVLITRSTGTCAIALGVNPGLADFLDVATLEHVTIADGAGHGLCVGEVDDDDWTLAVYNSVFWNNAGQDILTRREGGPSPVTLVNNTWQSVQINPGWATAPSGTLTSNPQFVNPAANDWELGGSSPSINSAFVLPNAINGVDLKGDPRLFASLADRGALESPIGSTATDLLVTSTADTATPGTLRQALLDANASPNFNRIRFNLGSTCGPRTIVFASPPPPIVHSVRIDGYSQPGSARNTAASGNNGQICVILRGSSGTISGLNVPNSVDENMQLQVEGLAFSDFPLVALQLAGGNGHTVLGSQFGGDLGSTNLLPSGYAVQVTLDAGNVQVGGPDAQDRNTIGEATIAAVALTGSVAGGFPSGALIQNNYIGLAADGTTTAPNQKGIILRGGNTRVADNVISANVGIGLQIDGAAAVDNLVEDNLFGLRAGSCFLFCDRGNGSHAILVEDGATRNLVRDNTLAHSGGDGVAVVAAEGNAVYRNTTYANVGEGIDLGDNGATGNSNDSAPPPAGAGNRNQNYPVLSVAIGNAQRGRVGGSLSSRNGWYRIDFYAGEDCGAIVPGQGRYPIGSASVQITNAGSGTDGSASFGNIIIERPGDPDFFSAAQRRIMATATRLTANPLDGGKPRDTSEFSACITYTLSDALFENGFE